MERKLVPPFIPNGYNPGGVTIKSSHELELMREAGRVVATTLQTLAESARAGMKTKELDIIASNQIKRLGAKPSFKGYRGFPATICVSVNNEIVHGIPGDRVLRDGDIVSLDAGAIVGGFQADSALTIGIGKLSAQCQELISTTKQALETGIAAARVGARVGDLSSAIQDFVERRGYSVVREYVGHGIGRELHEDPQIPNYGLPNRGPLLRRGMTIAIEPMVNIGGWRTRCLEDNWTVVTADGSLSAHFEDTIAITDDGAEILTRL
ncbi:MAG: type I methionyl aminopeptidase [Chloroflexi bacterium]|nr:type I methionyl aminopeptidase [Chloroflexota bacterium]